MSIVLDGTSGVIVSGNTNTLSGLTVGKGAGSVATNTAVGASALAAGTASNNNTTAIGYNALLVATGGSNLAVGSNALVANTTGDDNTAIGSYAPLAANTTGTKNIAVGRQALASNTTASNNTAVGYQAGYSNTTGAAGTFFGYQAGYSTTTANNGAFFGHKAGYSTTGAGNNFFGRSDQGFGAGELVTTGARNTILGGYNGNQGGLDIRTASNYIVLSDGDGNPRMYMNESGYLWCIGVYSRTTASASNVHVGAGGDFFRSTSALKYKQDVRDLEEMDINLLRAVRYKSKCEGDDQTKDHLGLIADEAAEAGFEELVTRGDTGEIEGFQYERLTVVLLKKLQTLSVKVDAQAAEIAALKGTA